MAQQDLHGRQNKHDTVTIHIDKKTLKSPNPTTGNALYALGQIPAGYDLWREVHGKGDDERISNDASQVVLKDGDHFYSAQSTLNPGNKLWTTSLN
jgi:hypothetical protein